MDAFVAECPACGERAATEQPNDIVAFYRRHTAVTGHDIVWERCPDEMQAAPAEQGLIAVIDGLADGEGVPLGAVSAAMSEQGWTVGETLEAVDDHRLTGVLWEPRDDHVNVV
ncbi:hypothetical protein [Haloplanus halobius]|uniref:hypothetical protein n=1 Tax=Haloplanus halobius TaxID=2934938 RepID=UPI0020105550|nr:hypothetical protein [Haloplanus sp. XH21]